VGVEVNNKSLESISAAQQSDTRQTALIGSAVASDEEMSASVHKDALRLLSGIRLFVEAREKEHVQSIIMDASLVCVRSEKSPYIS
jgi:hypothetical protein